MKVWRGGTHPPQKAPRYTQCQLKQAIEEAKKPNISFSEAASRFGVPKSTLIKKSNPTVKNKG